MKKKGNIAAMQAGNTAAIKVLPAVCRYQTQERKRRGVSRGAVSK
ncbi:hypothetical protein HBDW_00710 [Herbaspirillum sp. DW155]|nr:hypothetical protein HBDW_00710 [Herbaspirillum sp. DW155]